MRRQRARSEQHCLRQRRADGGLEPHSPSCIAVRRLHTMPRLSERVLVRFSLHYLIS